MDGTSPSTPGTRPTFVDLFAGCGGLSLGLMQARWTGLFAVEHDANAFATLAANLLDPKQGRARFQWPGWLPRTPHGVDQVLSTFPGELEQLRGKVDMVAGGPPCQGFSSAGKRNVDDPRNKLVLAYLSFVRIVRPRLVLIENVRGIKVDFKDPRAAGGKVNFASWIIEELSPDYVPYPGEIDTSDFGVPQKRHRVFIIGVRKDLVDASWRDPIAQIKQGQVSFLRAKGIRSVPVSSSDAISDLTVDGNGKRPSADSEGFEEIKYIAPRTSFQRLMREGCDEDPSDTRLARHRPLIEERFKLLRSEALRSGLLNVSLPREFKESLHLKKCSIRVLDPDAPAPTITSIPDDLIHYSEDRALTVRENARLQSFPDWFEFKGKYTSGGQRRRKEVPRFTQVANAVPPLAAEAIGIALREYLARIDRLAAQPMDTARQDRAAAIA